MAFTPRNTLTTFGRRSRESGTPVGMQLNTFIMDCIQASLTGEQLAQFLLNAAEGSRQQAYDEWAVLTGASRDSIELVVVEVEATQARIALQAGGEKLINDSRNKSGKDYAPFLEFNGSPSGKQPPGVLVDAIFSREREIKESLKDQIRAHLEMVAG